MFRQSPSINRHMYMLIHGCVFVWVFAHMLNDSKFIHKTSWWSFAWLSIIMHARVCAATAGNICISFCFLFSSSVRLRRRCLRSLPLYSPIRIHRLAKIYSFVLWVSAYVHRTLLLLLFYFHLILISLVSILCVSHFEFIFSLRSVPYRCAPATAIGIAQTW